MNSVALIHIAAHGDAERGEIALAPSFRIPNGIPQEGLYLLTMSDISRIQLRAKLVALSCCHSARGQTKAEGAVGIARALLGSGARSVLVSLWALDDKATEQFMSHFYDHLVAGESAGESLHEAMKWMRSEGYDVNQWAPFILIGDDVTFEFGKKGKTKWKQVLSYFNLAKILRFNESKSFAISGQKPLVLTQIVNKISGGEKFTKKTRTGRCLGHFLSFFNLPKCFIAV